VKYEFPPLKSSTSLEKDRPAVVMAFNSLDPETQPRIHDLLWKNRKVTARIARERYR
jgi:hypothetical protein